MNPVLSPTLKPASPAQRKARPGRPTREDAVERRAAFLAVALDAFLDKGFEGVSIHRLAQLAGISRDTFYRQYGTKEELFRAATAYGLNTMREHLAVTIDFEGEPEVVLLRAIRYMHADTTSPRALAVIRLIVAESHRFPDLARQMFADTYGFLKPLVEYLKRMSGKGVLEVDDAFGIAYFISTLASGGIRFLLDAPLESEQARDAYARRVLKLVLHGITGKTARPRF